MLLCIEATGGDGVGLLLLSDPALQHHIQYSQSLTYIFSSFFSIVGVINLSCNICEIVWGPLRAARTRQTHAPLLRSFPFLLKMIYLLANLVDARA